MRAREKKKDGCKKEEGAWGNKAKKERCKVEKNRKKKWKKKLEKNGLGTSKEKDENKGGRSFQ